MEYSKPKLTVIVDCSAASKGTNNAPDWRIRRLADKLSQTRGHATLRLRELSSPLRVTPAHIGKRFKQQLGIGFRRYSNLKRDEYVCELLRTTDLRVKEIASLNGYRRVCDLSHRFRQLHGLCPTMYRELFRSLEVNVDGRP